MNKSLHVAQSRLRPVLRELCFEITNDCPLRCEFCSTFNDTDRTVAPTYVDPDVCEEVITSFKKLGGEVLELSGGEPLLHPHIVQTVRFAKDQGLQVRLYTSGIARSDTERLIRRLAKNGLDRLVLNCQGPSQIHDALVGRSGTFERVLRTIRIAKNTGLWVGVHTIPVRQNVDKIGTLCRVLNAERVNEIAFLRLVRQGRAALNWGHLSLGPTEYELLVQKLTSLFRATKRTVFFSSRTSFTTNIRLGCPFQMLRVKHVELRNAKRSDLPCCHAGKRSLNVLSDGTVVPCPAFKDVEKARVGNVFETSLQKIWFNAPFLQTLRHRGEVSQCEHCTLWAQCGGGCTAQRFIAYHDLNTGPDPLCSNLTKTNTFQLFPLLHQKEVHKENVTKHTLNLANGPTV